MGSGIDSEMPLGVIKDPYNMIYALNLQYVNKTKTQLLTSNTTYKSGFIFSSNSSMTCMYMNYP